MAWLQVLEYGQRFDGDEEAMPDSGEVNLSCADSPVPALVKERGSLTAQLKRLAAPRRLAVRVLRQGEFPISAQERCDLGLAEGGPAHVREVILGPAAEPWVFARTVLPAAALERELAAVGRLDARPLGEWLFSHDNARRGAVTVVRVKRPGTEPSLATLAAIAPGAGPLWGRRSLFYVGAARLLVCEYFLPGLWHCRAAGGRDERDADAG